MLRLNRFFFPTMFMINACSPNSSKLSIICLAMTNLTNVNLIGAWICILFPVSMSSLHFFCALFVPYLSSSTKGPPGSCLNISYNGNFTILGSVVLRRSCSCLKMANINPKSLIKFSNFYLVFSCRTVPNVFRSNIVPLNVYWYHV